MSKNVMPAAVYVMPQRGMRPPPPDASQKRQDSVGPDRQNMDAEVLVLLKMHAGAGCVCVHQACSFLLVLLLWSLAGTCVFGI